MSTGGRLVRALTACGHALWRPWLKRRLGRVSLEHVDGVPLVVLPEVFNPAVFRSGAFLARAVSGLEAPAGGGRRRVLDLGTGSGVGAVFAARRGWRVVAVDVNPQAVRCARLNALLNDLEERIEARHGDLFTPVMDERFDLVLFNPPYFRGRPRNPLDAAWRSPDVLERFAAGLPAALRPGGRALVVLSTDGDGDSLLDALARRGLTIEPACRRRFGNEVLTAWSVAAATAAAAAGGDQRTRARRAGRRRLWRARTSS
ncbi:MAG: methyltransferase domain-containing protein [Acidobacteria bacterium]|nr:MAG: methyltransferase domain-containing protein [Acidobacteriota bacterium]